MADVRSKGRRGGSVHEMESNGEYAAFLQNATRVRLHPGRCPALGRGAPLERVGCSALRWGEWFAALRWSAKTGARDCIVLQFAGKLH
jgi:hypothetical protein